MHPIVLIVSASGGLGASTLAAVTAALCARDASPVLVDAAFGSGGLDATVAIEHLEGLRWGDLAEHEGEMDAGAVRRALPEGRVPVLAARGSRPAVGTVREVISALATVGPVIVDLPSAVPVPSAWREVADRIVVIVGLRPRWLRDGQACTEMLGDDAGRAWLVTRGPRRSAGVAARAAHHLGLPLLEHLRDDPGVARDEARGRAPRPRGAVGEVARALVAAMPAVRTATVDRVLGSAS